MNVSNLKKAHRCGRAVAATLARFPALSGMRRTFPARREAAARHPFDDEAERRREWRHQSFPESHGRSWLVWSRQSQCGGSRTDDAQPADDDSTGEPAGLQLVCADAVPARLRHFKSGRTTRMLFDQRLQSIGRVTWRRSNGLQAGALATCQKNANGGPATVRSAYKTFRYGTKRKAKVTPKQDFVPLRYKTPSFRGSHRSATGHLYRLAIYRGISRC